MAEKLSKLRKHGGGSAQSTLECGGKLDAYACTNISNGNRYSKMSITCNVTIRVYGISSFYTGNFGGNSFPSGTLLYEGKNGSDINISGYDYICFGKKTYSDVGNVRATLA